MKKENKAVIIWLLSGCLLIFLMVVVGGITRLTNSGLSMTDWHLITDTLPPLTEAKWQEAFEQYKKFPEYQKINIHNDFQLSDYKFIYFWEWFHRFIGRAIGMVFIIPFIYFLIRKRLDNATIKKCLILLGLGGLQGFFGWFMVKSGLIDNPDVSHFRLALHLTTAFITFAYTFWVALDLIYPVKRNFEKTLRSIARYALFFLLLQIIYGGFVAGLNAGLIHNHWPLMSDGQFIHDSVFLEQDSLLLSFTEGKSGVQFIHRTLAYVVVALILFLYFKSRKFNLDYNQKKGIQTLVFLVFVQFALGVFTLLYGVPLWLGLIHQVNAFFLLSAMTYSLHRLSK
ncbi:cytochrome c oxidase assembly protein subunit 15 [Flavobacterium glycines]|uniref:Heme A synthase n=1 Tax=Flavobacterium glycines TaxID=551990 RepID=A0A1B9DGF5_9FLAO|nr:COX15/CtaA family protein [Flavobacterium glycines]OCB68729.1 heme A synthase [Flavobacterium glycines]GEL11402.1 heme A synthase [Flavobacterium glycines]SDJ66246.1 cytochrome c oxidase assembly protein subunit 15 [Flavobacterium glycines]